MIVAIINQEGIWRQGNQAAAVQWNNAEKISIMSHMVKKNERNEG